MTIFNGDTNFSLFRHDDHLIDDCWLRTTFTVYHEQSTLNGRQIVADTDSIALRKLQNSASHDDRCLAGLFVLYYHYQCQCWIDATGKIILQFKFPH